MAYKSTRVLCHYSYETWGAIAPQKYHGGSRMAWTPEIRMLDKDEKLVEPSLEQRMRDSWTFSPGPHMQWPPMDPVNPTKEQLRVKNTSVGTNFWVHRYVNAHRTGFRTVPKELIDWRSTVYGEMYEDLYANPSKPQYSNPDYCVAGLMYTADETEKLQENIPRTASETGLGCTYSPKIDLWMRYKAAKNDRNLWSFTSITASLVSMFIFGYLATNLAMKERESNYRRARIWWDGANSGTWKYGGRRQISMSQSLSGGSIIPYTTI